MRNRARHRMGAGGSCICLRCGEKVPHQSGTPCREARCPACGAALVREGSEHHRLYQERRADKQVTE